MEYTLLNYNNFLKNNLKHKDISNREFLYLFNIFYQKTISQKELADLMYVSEANIAKMIKKLEKKGYVSRHKDQNNKSRNIICLSKKGIEQINKLIQLTNQWELEVSKINNVQNINDFKDILYAISENSVDLE